MVGESLPATLPLVAALGRDTALSLPERHLGLVQAGELPDLDARLDRWADAWAAAVAPGFEAPAVTFASAPAEPVPRLLDGVVIAVARDTAFSFIYPANVLSASGENHTSRAPSRSRHCTLAG